MNGCRITAQSSQEGGFSLVPILQMRRLRFREPRAEPGLGVRPAELKPDGPRSHWWEPLYFAHGEPSSSFLHTRGCRAKNCLRALPAPTHSPKPGGVFLALHSLLQPVEWRGRSWALLPAIIQGPRLLPFHGSSALLGVLREAHSGGFNGPVQSGTQPADQGSVPWPHLTQGSLGDDVWGFVRVGEVAGSSANILGKLYLLCYNLPTSDTTCFPKWNQDCEIPLAAGGQWVSGRVWLRPGEA